MLDLLGRRAPLANRDPADDDWYLNLLWIDQRKCLLLTHAGTLFSVFRADIRSAAVRPLGAYLAEAIESELSAEQLPIDTFPELQASSVLLARTSSRRTLSFMTEMATEARYMIVDQGGLSKCDTGIANQRLRRGLHNRDGYVTPIELVEANATRPERAARAARPPEIRSAPQPPRASAAAGHPKRASGAKFSGRAQLREASVLNRTTTRRHSRIASTERRVTRRRGSVEDPVSDNVDIEAARDVAKVRFVANDRRMVRAELRSNRASVDITFNSEPTSLAVGDVIFVEQEENQIDPAPAGLWVDDRWIGVVRLITDELTVVTDGSGHLRRLLTREDLKVEEGNTVECDDGGVLKVLGERPVRTLDLREEDEIDLSAFVRAPAEQNTSFEDFGGLQDIVVRARELVEVPLERHEALKVIGARPIKGVLFTGPPGTGKTMLARLIAGQAGAKFYAISGPTIFSKWYGESEAVLRRIFADAAEHQPSIIFFDEIDSVAVRRDQEAHEASKRVVAQLLTLMDGFESNANVIVIAATNRRDAIDEALLRPGRFDWEIEFRMPEADDRLPILERAGNSVATRGVLPLALIAGLTDGWSAAELALVWSEAALLAAVDDRKAVVGEDLLGGYERVALRHGRVDREMARV